MFPQRTPVSVPRWWTKPRQKSQSKRTIVHEKMRWAEILPQNINLVKWWKNPSFTLQIAFQTFFLPWGLHESVPCFDPRYSLSRLRLLLRLVYWHCHRYQQVRWTSASAKVGVHPGTVAESILLHKQHKQRQFWPLESIESREILALALSTVFGNLLYCRRTRHIP